jgi:CheY-like chemotaxis protein
MVLKGNLDIVLSDEELGQDNIFLLNEIDKGIKRAALITGQMKNLSKCRKGKKTRLFLDDILKNIVEKALEQYDIDFTLETAKDLWPALVNITSFEHALECFIKNSVQAVQSAQGQIKKFLIEIRAENITVSKEVSRKKNIIPGEYVKISVSDFGPGIPIDQEDKIFTPYFTTKKSSIGLGLSMCEWIANDHCGYVFLEQNKALGKDKTVFSICLPVNVKESACSSEALGDAILKDKKNVLLMDDDQAVRTAVKIMLKRLDFEASGTCDGQSAIEAYKTAHVNKTPYDLVVLDLVVPGKMGGIEAAREIRRVDSKAKIIGMTGYSSEDMETNYSDYGFDAFLEKPFSLKDLEAAVSQIKAV